MPFRSYRSLLLRFEPPLGGGLGTTYDGHLGLVGKRVVDFLLNFFSSGVMADALREN